MGTASASLSVADVDGREAPAWGMKHWIDQRVEEQELWGTRKDTVPTRTLDSFACLLWLPTGVLTNGKGIAWEL